MKNLILIFLLVFSPMTFAKNDRAKETEIYYCKGFSQENLEEADVLVAIVKSGKRFIAEFQLPGSESKRIKVKKISQEVSLYDSYSNETEQLQVDVSLDDVGGMSSISYKEENYSITCAESL